MQRFHTYVPATMHKSMCLTKDSNHSLCRGHFIDRSGEHFMLDYFIPKNTQILQANTKSSAFWSNWRKNVVLWIISIQILTAMRGTVQIIGSRWCQNLAFVKRLGSGVGHWQIQWAQSANIECRRRKSPPEAKCSAKCEHFAVCARGSAKQNRAFAHFTLSPVWPWYVNHIHTVIRPSLLFPNTDLHWEKNSS